MTIPSKNPNSNPNHPNSNHQHHQAHSQHTHTHSTGHPSTAQQQHTSTTHNTFTTGNGHQRFGAHGHEMHGNVNMAATGGGGGASGTGQMGTNLVHPGSGVIHSPLQNGVTLSPQLSPLMNMPVGGAVPPMQLQARQQQVPMQHIQNIRAFNPQMQMQSAAPMMHIPTLSGQQMFVGYPPQYLNQLQLQQFQMQQHLQMQQQLMANQMNQFPGQYPFSQGLPPHIQSQFIQGPSQFTPVHQHSNLDPSAHPNPPLPQNAAPTATLPLPGGKPPQSPVSPMLTSTAPAAPKRRTFAIAIIDPNTNQPIDPSAPQEKSTPTPQQQPSSASSSSISSSHDAPISSKINDDNAMMGEAPTAGSPITDPRKPISSDLENTSDSSKISQDAPEKSVENGRDTAPEVSQAVSNANEPSSSLHGRSSPAPSKVPVATDLNVNAPNKEKEHAAEKKSPTATSEPSFDNSTAKRTSPVANTVANCSALDTPNTRLTYTREFLMQFSHIEETPSSFPTNIDREILQDKSAVGMRGGDKWAHGIKRQNSNEARGVGGQDVRRQNNYVPGPATPRDRNPNAGPPRFDGAPVRRDERNMKRSGSGAQIGRNERSRQPPPSIALLGGLPVAPIVHSEDRWVAGRQETDEYNRVKKKILSLLNKLTLDKFEVISNQIIETIKEHRHLGMDLLTTTISVIFDKALSESFFANIYSDMCVKVARDVGPLFEEEGGKQKNVFKSILLNQCQAEFDRGRTVIDPAGKTADEIAELEGAQKRRELGNIRFIGELYVKKMISVNVMHHCVCRLLLLNQGDDNAVPTEEDIEALCNLFKTIGKNIDQPTPPISATSMPIYFKKLDSLSKNMKYSSRIRFMIMDLKDLRASNWEPRQKKAEAKTKEQIRAENEAELAAKANARYAPYPSAPPRTGGNVFTPSVPKVAMAKPSNHASSTSTASSTSPFQRPPEALASGNSLNGTTSAPQVLPSTLRPANLGPTRRTPLGPERKSPIPSTASTPQAAPSQPPEPPVDTKAIESSIKSLIREYLTNKSIKDFRAAIEDLKQPQLHYLIISSVIPACLTDNASRKEIDSYIQLCSALQEERILQSRDYDKGVELYLSLIPAEYLEDFPRITEFIAKFLSPWILKDYLNPKIFPSSLKRFAEAGDATGPKLFIAILELCDQMDSEGTAKRFKYTSSEVQSLFIDEDDMKYYFEQHPILPKLFSLS